MQRSNTFICLTCRVQAHNAIRQELISSTHFSTQARIKQRAFDGVNVLFSIH
jgi:hypothetical protein